MARRRSVQSATNIDLTDREMLANIHEAAGPAGWASTTEIAIACGFTANGKNQTPAVKVASRLGWMRSGQLLESASPDLSVPYTEPGSRDTQWRLTPIGNAIRTGKISRAVENALEKMDPGSQVLLMRQLGLRGYREGEVGVAFALRREMQHHLAHRRLQLR